MKTIQSLLQNKARLTLGYLLCIAFALLFEASELHLIYGIAFSFSSIFLLFAVSLFGVRLGLLAGVITQLFSFFFLHNPAFEWIGLLEIAGVGLLNRKKPGRLLVWDSIYWLLIGLPLMFAVYYGFYKFVSDELILMLLIALSNGLFNGLIADILLKYLPLFHWFGLVKERERTYSYSKVLFHLSIMAVALPSLLYIVMNSWYSEKLSIQNSRQLAINTANSINQELNQWEAEDILGIKLKGRIQVGYLQELVNKYTSEQLFRIVITDRSNKVLAADRQSYKLNQIYDWKSGNNVLGLDDNFYQVLPARETAALPAQQWREGSYIYDNAVARMPLNVYIDIPIRHYQVSVFAQYLSQLWYLLLFAAAAAATALYLSRVLVHGLSKLATSTTDLPEKLKQMKEIEWPSSRVSEITSLTYNFRQMSLNLMSMFHQAQDMNQRLQEQTDKLRLSEEKLHQLAFYDILTGLPNRLYFTTYLQSLLLEAAQAPKQVAVMFADLNRFKQINDTLGHDIGDLLLKEIGERFTRSVAESCKLFRIGGDEFVIVIEDASDAKAVAVARSMFAALEEPIRLMESPLYSSVSIGISMFPRDGDTMETIVKNADMAMYFAKSVGCSNSYQFYEEELKIRFSEEMMIDNGIQEALSNHQLVLHYQPKVDTVTGAISGIEALVRWEHPELGRISPDKFIPLAERSGIIYRIDEWVLKEACRQNKAWQDEGLPKVPVAVNISALHFSQTNLLDMIHGALEESGLEESYLTLEITEGVFIEDVELVIGIISRIRERGIHISIDDFGTGYSSLNQLQRLPISHVKLDRSFIRDIGGEPKKAAVAKAIIELAHSMNMTVVAEGVETAEESEYFTRCRCDELQGYYFSRPLPAPEFSRLLQRGNYAGLFAGGRTD
ncbi:putative bifunctional diguanylate cyclase/phosphodiesterase [Paenibacillus chitinolyticus]